MRKIKLLIISLIVIIFLENGCKAKSCPSYLDDAPRKKSLFKKHKKTKNGLFTKKQRRY